MANPLKISDWVAEQVAAGVKPEAIRAELARVGYAGEPAAKPVQAAPAPAAAPVKDTGSDLNIPINWLAGRAQLLPQAGRAVADEAAALAADTLISARQAISPSVIHVAKFTDGPNPRRTSATVAVPLNPQPQSSSLQTALQTRQELLDATRQARPLDTIQDRASNLLAGATGVLSRVMGTDVPVAQYRQPLGKFQSDEAQRSFETAKGLVGGALGLPAGLIHATAEAGPQVLAYGAPDVAALTLPHMGKGIAEAVTGKPVRAAGVTKVVPEAVRDAEVAGFEKFKQYLDEAVHESKLTPEEADLMAQQKAGEMRTRLSAPETVEATSPLVQVGKTLKHGLAGEIVGGSLGLPVGAGALLNVLRTMPLPERMKMLGNAGQMSPELVAAYRRVVATPEAQADPRAEAALRPIVDMAHLQQGVENYSPELRNIYEKQAPELVTDKAQGAEFANRPGELNTVVESTEGGQLQVPEELRAKQADVEAEARNRADLVAGAKMYAKSLPDVYRKFGEKLDEHVAAAKFFRKAYWMHLERQIEALKLHDKETRALRSGVYDEFRQKQEALSPQFEEWRAEKGALQQAADTMYGEHAQQKYAERAGQAAERTALKNEQAATREELKQARELAWTEVPSKLQAVKTALSTARDELANRHAIERSDLQKSIQEYSNIKRLVDAAVVLVASDESLPAAERAALQKQLAVKYFSEEQGPRAETFKELWDELQQDHAKERKAFEDYARETLKPNGRPVVELDEHLRQILDPHVNELVKVRIEHEHAANESRRAPKQFTSQKEQLRREHERQSDVSAADRQSQISVLRDLRKDLENKKILLLDRVQQLKDQRETRLQNLATEREIGRAPWQENVDRAWDAVDEATAQLKGKVAERKAVPGQKMQRMAEVRAEQRGFMKDLSELNTGAKQAMEAGVKEKSAAGNVPVLSTNARMNEIASDLSKMTQRFTQPSDRVPASWYKRVVTDPLLPDGLTKIRSPRFRAYMEGEYTNKIREMYGDKAASDFKRSLDEALLSLDSTLLGAEPQGLTLKVGDKVVPLREAVRAASETLQRTMPQDYREMQGQAVEHNMRSLGKQVMESQFAHALKAMAGNTLDHYRDLTEQPARIAEKVAADVDAGKSPDLILPYEVKSAKGVLNHVAPDTPAGKWLDTYVPMPADLKQWFAKEAGGAPDHLWIQRDALKSVRMAYDQMRGFAEADRAITGFEQGLSKLLNFFKMTHTILSKGTHWGNLTANVLYDTVMQGKMDRVPKYLNTLNTLLSFEKGIEPKRSVEAEGLRRLLKTGKVRTNMLDVEAEQFGRGKSPVQGRAKQAGQTVIHVAGKAYSLGDAVPKLTSAMENYADTLEQMRTLGEGKTLALRYVSGDIAQLKKVGGGWELNGKPVSLDTVKDLVADQAIDHPLSWTFDFTKAPAWLQAQKRAGAFGKIVGGIAPFTQWLTHSTDAPGKPGLVSRMLEFDANAHASDDPAIVRRNAKRIFETGLRRMMMMGALQNVGDEQNKDAEVQARTQSGVGAGAVVRPGDKPNLVRVNAGTTNPWIGTLALAKALNYLTAKAGGAVAQQGAIERAAEDKNATPTQSKMIQAKMRADSGDILNDKDMEQLFQRGGEGLLRVLKPAVKGEVGGKKIRQSDAGTEFLTVLDFISPELRNLGDVGLGLTASGASSRRILRDDDNNVVDEPVPEMVVRMLFHSADRVVDAPEQARKWAAHVGSAVKSKVLDPLQAEAQLAQERANAAPNDPQLQQQADKALAWFIAAQKALSRELQAIQNKAKMSAADRVLGAIREGSLPEGEEAQ